MINDFRDDLNTIKYIAVANGYNSLTIDKLLTKHERSKLKPRINSNTQTNVISTNYTKFMPKILSSVLNNNSFTISFRTNNKLLSILRPKKHTPPEEKTYIGQTGRDFLKRLWEHIPKKIRNNNMFKRLEVIFKEML